jgi:pimeloyl-ACP methyl ester carboxylesterase
MINILRWQLRLFIGLSALIYLFSFGVVSAQTPCGNITGPDNIINQSNIVTVPIDDCADPFKVTIDPASPYTLNLNGVTVEAGGSIVLTEINTNDILIEGEPNLSTYSTALFKHEGDDYVFVESESVIGEGTYTLVIEEYELILSQRSLMERLKHAIVPTAHAQSFLGPYTYVITFTLTELLPEPTGASSVLFLPGIQASRLYKDLFNDETDQLWEPNADNDVAQLEMDEDGFSINDIYTKDVLDEIALPLAGSNIYKGFLEMLNDMKEEEVIADSTAFAYDWRYGVQDIVYSGTLYETGIKSLISEVERLATSSYTGKVTIIGHSNGGILAKALITELKELGEEDLVDKVVFVGVPQLGTPKSIGVLLHGMDQQKLGGLVIDDSTTRDVIRNMPGVYALLPSQKYFDVSGDTLVSTNGTPAAETVAEYGAIDSLLKLSDFVLDTKGLRDDDVPINEPSTLNSKLMQNMVDERTKFDNWLAPAGIEVYEVVGTGIATIKGFEYRSFPCVAAYCELFGNKYMKAYPLMTNEGDETVVSLSAEAYGGDKVKGAVDLEREGAQLSVFTKTHKNMTESPTIQKFIDSIIRFPYLNETLEIPQEFIESSTEYTLIGAHSPVDISLITSNNKRVGIFDGVRVEEVVGSQYFELGGSKYIVVPKEVEYEVKVQGNDTGVYSLTIDSLDSEDIQKTEHTYLGASTSLQMIATFKASSTGFSSLKTDLDGDGDIDLEQTLDGILVVPPASYTYTTLISEIKLLQLNKLYKNVLLLQAQLSERLSKESKRKLELVSLTSLQSTLKLYERKRLITPDQSALLTKIINYLKK